MNHKTLAGIAIGGFAGAICRYELSQISAVWGLFSLNILCINLIGAFLLAGFIEISMERLSLSAPVRTGISTGFLGAFTTFSGLCSEAFGLNSAGGMGAAGFYLALSMAGGLFGALGGIAAARIFSGPSGESHE